MKIRSDDILSMVRPILGPLDSIKEIQISRNLAIQDFQSSHSFEGKESSKDSVSVFQS